MKKILLVAPLSPESQYLGIEKLSFLRVKATMTPLHLATIAALTPDDIEVDLWDEPVHGQIDGSTELKDYDLVGVTGYSSHLQRAKEIAKVFRKRGIPVAIGGVGGSTNPERYREFSDILFIGEAELTWPQFIADWKAGSYRKEYRQVTKPDLAISPLPRWDSLPMKSYLTGAVQTTRGCPFDCEFCDVIYLFGRRPRHKPIDRVLEEVAVLERLGMEHIFFCDDEFIGDPHYVKELLRELIPLNRSFQSPVTFLTQLTINMAQDDELLELMADANFNTLFVGIETPNEESLKETNKVQNLRGDLLADCIKVQSYGMFIRAGMIVGFDHDDMDIFDKQFEFLQEACIPLPSITLLRAMPGARLWRRLLNEGRLLKADIGGYYANLMRTNIIPKRMTRVELLSGYLDLIQRIYDWNNSVARLKGFISGITRQPQVPKKKRKLKRLFQLIRFLFSVDKDTRRAVIEIVLHTRKHAPFMMDKVLGLILQLYGFIYLVRLQREEMQKEIDIEKKVDMKQFIELSELVVPESFEEPYKEIFPEIYDRVYTGLNDKTRTDEALIEVFTDFLTRWGQTLDSFSNHHKVFLHELADRAIAKENSATKSESSVLVQRDEAVPDIKKVRLAEEVLKAVEQELRCGKGAEHWEGKRN